MNKYTYITYQVTIEEEGRPSVTTVEEVIEKTFMDDMYFYFVPIVIKEVASQFANTLDELSLVLDELFLEITAKFGSDFTAEVNKHFVGHLEVDELFDEILETGDASLLNPVDSYESLVERLEDKLNSQSSLEQDLFKGAEQRAKDFFAKKNDPWDDWGRESGENSELS